MHSELSIRRIAAADNDQVAALIRRTMTDLGVSGPGFSVHDAEVNNMEAAYRDDLRAYYAVVVDAKGKVYGGAGIAPLSGGPLDVCELKKMYFEPSIRKLGFGRALLELLLQKAVRSDFRGCYLETLASMQAAQRLYTQAGFVQIAAPMGSTGHHGCDRWYYRALGQGTYWPVVMAKNRLKVAGGCEIKGSSQD